MNEVIKTPRARQDLIDLATYLYAVDPTSDASERLLTASENAFTRLAEMPYLGIIYPSDFGRQANIRRWPVPGFRSYLIFYRPIETGVEIIRVLHGARDISAALLEEDATED
jgi:toxin ParE1/3/4